MTLRRLWTQLPFFLWLVVLWMLLWGQFTVLAALTGVVVAIVVTTAFRLPTAELSGRVNLFWLVVFVGSFLVDLVLGALQVAWQTIVPSPPSTAIIRAPLRVDEDLIMTHTAVAMSLVPGTSVIEADRTHRVLYLHAIGVKNDADIEKVRRSVLTWEKRIVRAVGSRADVETVRLNALPFVERVEIREGGRS